MERKSSDIEADPHLRPGFYNQVSLDEFIEHITIKLETTEDLSETQIRLRSAMRVASEEAIRVALRPHWQARLNPQTNMTELLYLQGYTDITARTAVLDQHYAELNEAQHRTFPPAE